MMKVAFSTLGCPDWPWPEIIASAKDLGYDAIEVRGIENELYAPKMKPFLGRNLAVTKEKLASLHLVISMLTSACVLGNKENAKVEMAAAKEYIDLAAEAEIPFMRVLVEPQAEPVCSLQTDLPFAADALYQLGEYAKGSKVKILAETNGVLADSQTMRGFIAPIAGDHVGVLWDTHHPYRFYGEAIADTYANLKPYIAYLHLKDSQMINGKLVYRLLGNGDIPVDDVLKLLQKEAYDSYVSLEWVKRWNKDLEEPGIVFPQFIQYVKRVIG